MLCLLFGHLISGFEQGRKRVLNGEHNLSILDGLISQIAGKEACSAWCTHCSGYLLGLQQSQYVSAQATGGALTVTGPIHVIFNYAAITLKMNRSMV